MNILTNTDVAQAAAYIDGEGCIRVRLGEKGNSQGSMSVAVSNTDPRLVVWLKDRFGGNVYSYPGQSRSGRRMYRWEVSGKRANALLLSCLRFFVIKKEQAELAIAFQRTMRTVPRGAVQLEPTVKQLRQRMVAEMIHLHRNCPDNPDTRMIQ